MDPRTKGTRDIPTKLETLPQIPSTAGGLAGVVRKDNGTQRLDLLDGHFR